LVGERYDVTLSGVPGDRVFLVSSTTPAFNYSGPLKGMWLVPFPWFLPSVAVAVVPPSGVATIPMRLGISPPGASIATTTLQALVIDAGGTSILGGPVHVVVLKCGALQPDCNANGQFDTCDLVRGTSPDCSLNSIPDECEPDCNANVVPDSCDIAQGTSLDLNHNGIPDECEPTQTRYVDDSAPPGGNGTAGSPFRTIGEAIAVSLPADTVIVEDGTYVGPSNRQLDFTGRDIELRSAHGPSNCTIDCELAGQAFRFVSGETAAALIEGFTIVRGKSQLGGNFIPGGAMYIVGSHPRIQNCVFRDCFSNAEGGALHLRLSNSVIRSSRFENNHSNGNGGGGGIYWFRGRPRIEGCTFVANTSNNTGGAILLAQPDATSTDVVSRCIFLRNACATTGPGGALYVTTGNTNTIVIDECWFAGNTAQRGGGFSGQGNVSLLGCTFVDNRALSSGGGAQADHGGQIQVANSIVWHNTAPAGSQLYVNSSSTVLTVAYSNIEGGAAGVGVGSGSLSWGAGNLTASPQFVDRDGPDNDPTTVDDNDYRLGPASPCIDAGDNARIPADWFDLDGDGDFAEQVPFDLDGNPRRVDIPGVPDTGSGPAPVVDMGAWERLP
jgi:hypothetical protein